MSPELQAILISVATFASVGLLVWFAFFMFTSGWKGYENRFVSDMDRTLDAMFLTVSRESLVYLAIASALAIGSIAAVGFHNLLFGVIMGSLGLPLPVVILRLLKARRDKKFNIQLVDALFGMGNALRAGFSLPLAFEMIAREMENPMGQEMRVVVQEMRVGVSMEDALRHLAARMPSEDLDLLITAILISREVGGNLTEVFDNIASTVRERLRLQGKIRALTAQGKLQGIVVAMLPIAIGLGLNLLQPGLFKPMYTTWQGAAILGGVALLEALGAWFIYRIVTIKI